jgi:hypothetical protein
MHPVTAAAAQAAGDARYIEAWAFPIRALKFRLAVEITLTPSPGIGPAVPQQEPHPAGVIVAPSARSLSSVPSRCN